MLFNALPRHEQSKSIPIHFLNIHFNIIFPYSQKPSEWPLSSTFPNQNHKVFQIFLDNMERAAGQNINLDQRYRYTRLGWETPHFLPSLAKQYTDQFNHLTPNGHYMGRTAQLTSRYCILYIYSTNINTEYFKHAA